MFSNQCKKEALKSHLFPQSPTTNLAGLRATIKEADNIEGLLSGRLKRTQHQKKKGPKTRAWAPSNTKLSVGNPKKRHFLPKFKNIFDGFLLESSHSKNEQNGATKWSKTSASASPHTKPRVGDPKKYFIFKLQQHLRWSSN